MTYTTNTTDYGAPILTPHAPGFNDHVVIAWHDGEFTTVDLQGDDLEYIEGVVEATVKGLHDDVWWVAHYHDERPAFMMMGAMKKGTQQ